MERFGLYGKTIDERSAVDLLLDVLEEMESEYSKLVCRAATIYLYHCLNFRPLLQVSGQFCESLPPLTHKNQIHGVKECTALVYQHGDFTGWKGAFSLPLTQGGVRSVEFFGEDYIAGNAVDKDASSLKVFMHMSFMSFLLWLKKPNFFLKVSGSAGCSAKVFGNRFVDSIDLREN